MIASESEFTPRNVQSIDERRHQVFGVKIRVANPDVPGFTVWQPVRTEAPQANRRVDYVLVAPGGEAPVRVGASRVILDRPGRGADGKALWPSDHYGVLSEVEVF